MKRSFLVMAMSSFPFLLTACGSITGLQNAKSDFACSVDLSPRCASLSSVHESLDKEELKQNETISRTVVISKAGSFSDPIITDTPLMAPKRSPEEILRVWVAPYIDEEGDLHAEHMIFTTIREAHWAPETLDIKPINDASRKMITPLKTQD